MNLKIKLWLKKIFNKILPKRARNAILRLFGRDYEISSIFLNNLDFKNLEKQAPKGDFIVSLTTFPARINIVKFTLYSMLAQSLRPKKIILALSKEEFSGVEIPREILELEKFGVEILWGEENFRSYNKLIFARARFKNEVIVTIDDDIFYPKDLLKSLWQAHLSDKSSIWAHRARVISMNGREIGGFASWKLIKKNDKYLQNKPSFRHFLEGVGGVLYPPNSLHCDAFKPEIFTKLAPKADDVWFWAMAVLNGTKIAVVENNAMSNGNAMTISPYGEALWLNNLMGENDKQLKAILARYNGILQQLSENRILQFGKFYPPDIGGIESVMGDITESLNKKGVVCDVLCSNSKFKNECQRIPCGAQITRTASFGKLASTSISPQMIVALKKIIKHYDIIHLHLPDPMACVALLFTNLNNKKLVIHWHSDIIKQKRLLKLFLPIQNRVLKMSDKIIATSQKYIEESSQLAQFRHKCVSIPIGIQKIESKNAPNPFPTNKKIIFSLGRFRENKGFKYLIESAIYLNDEYAICIGGGGNEGLRNEFLDLIKKNNLENKVFLLGNISRENVWNYYQHCHIFVLPSLQESYGIVLVEALSFGVPLICTKLKPSGADFINKDGISGKVVLARDSAGIAEAILEIDKNYNFYAKNAKARFQSHFELDLMIEKIMNLYSAL